jgi:hypothetical protein
MTLLARTGGMGPDEVSISNALPSNFTCVKLILRTRVHVLHSAVLGVIMSPHFNSESFQKANKARTMRPMWMEDKETEYCVVAAWIYYLPTKVLRLRDEG